MTMQEMVARWLYQTFGRSPSYRWENLTDESRRPWRAKAAGVLLLLQGRA